MKNIEIERKFLVDKEKWAALEKPVGKSITQGYLYADEEKVIRVRIAGDTGFITIKGRAENLARPEYEYSIPKEDASEMLRFSSGHIITKIRYNISFDGKTWEVDVFSGENEGLVLAEIELKNAAESFQKPDWITLEVTQDLRYYNSWLSKYPYSIW
jgi:adenylate cyclase